MYEGKSTAVVIGHNAGLGDLIVMNGAVRYLASQYDKTYLVCWNSRLKHVEFVYRDDDKIIPFVKPHPRNTHLAISRHKNAHKILVERNPEVEFAPFRRGLFNKETEWLQQAQKYNLPNDIIWPKVFYAIQGVSYEKRYENYFLQRDHQREDGLFESLNLPEEYVFVVRDTRKYKFSLEPPTSLPVVDPANYDWSNTLIFDWMKVIENASEIHVVDTCWLHLIRMMQLNVPKFYWAERDIIMTGSGYLNDGYDSGWERTASLEPVFTVKPSYHRH